MCKVKAPLDRLKPTKIDFNFKLEFLGRLNTVDFLKEMFWNLATISLKVAAYGLYYGASSVYSTAVRRRNCLLFAQKYHKNEFVIQLSCKPVDMNGR